MPEIIRDGYVRYRNRMRRLTKQLSKEEDATTTSERNGPLELQLSKEDVTTIERNGPLEEKEEEEEEEPRCDAGMPKEEYRFLVIDKSRFLTLTTKKKRRTLPANLRVVEEEKIFEEIAKIDESNDDVKTVVVLLRPFKEGSSIGNRLFTSIAPPLHLAQVKFGIKFKISSFKLGPGQEIYLELVRTG